MLLLGAVIAGPLSADPPSWAGRWKHNPRVQDDRGDRDGRHDGAYGRRDVVLHGVVTHLNMREGTFRLATRDCEAYTVIVSRERTRPRKKPVGLRLRPDYLDAIKRVADRRGIPYQTLIQMWLAEKLRQEAPDLMPQ